MKPDVRAVDRVVPAVRNLLEQAGVPFKFAGGIAVVHHGYARLTDDVDVLVDLSTANRLDELLASHEFLRESAERLRHVPTGVAVDLLISGQPMPRPGSPAYPSLDTVEASPDDADMVGLRPLLELKLHARRHKDLADVVELVKRLGEGRYLELEASITRDLRSELAALRRDALEELSFEKHDR